ncbi:Hypothetical predicted protein [Cloeon dipterum]|uniref:Uncharacterized protein n=1 Tax=Cloeon dipterum TaxID=197152 RepID=A0A8S1CLK1_9INSE|nr:Hypothetical predicted protein [Cloeon dipterum]
MFWKLVRSELIDSLFIKNCLNSAVNTVWNQISAERALEMPRPRRRERSLSQDHEPKRRRVETLKDCNPEDSSYSRCVPAEAAGHAPAARPSLGQIGFDSARFVPPSLAYHPPVMPALELYIAGSPLVKRKPPPCCNSSEPVRPSPFIRGIPWRSSERAQRSRQHERGTSGERRYKRSNKRSPTSGYHSYHHSKHQRSSHRQSKRKSPSEETPPKPKTTHRPPRQHSNLNVPLVGASYLFPCEAALVSLFNFTPTSYWGPSPSPGMIPPPPQDNNNNNDPHPDNAATASGVLQPACRQ